MPVFTFHGRDARGNSKSGERLAHTADSLSAQLIKEGIIPVDIRPVKKINTLWQQIKNRLMEKEVLLEELAIFARQMYLLCKTGVSLSHALRRLAESTANKGMVSALYGIVESLESGQDLASAMQAYPKLFSPLMIGMVQIGQSSGRLDQAFLRMNQYIELEASAIRQVKTAVRYPVFVFISIVAAMVLVNIFVIPAFAHVFAQSGIKLPWPTRLLMNVSGFFTHHWLIAVVSLGIIVASVGYYVHTPRGKFLWHYYQLRLPVIGSLLRRITLLRFAQSFAIALESGVPLIEAIGLVSGAISNQYARQQMLTMKEAIEQGNSLTQAAAMTQLFTPLELQILTVSEETGEMSSMLEQIALFHQREVEYDIKRLSDIVEPLLLILLALMVLTLALAVYLPIWDMVKLVHT